MTKIEQIKQQLNQGKLEISENTQYQEMIIKIVKATLEEGGNSNLPHPLLESSQSKGQIFLCLDLSIQGNDKERRHIEVSNFQTRAGKIAYYPSIDETGLVGTLLHDVVSAIKKFSQEQSQEFSDSKIWSGKLPEILEGKMFNMGVKVGTRHDGTEFIILESSRVKAKDQKYRESKSPIEDFTNKELDDVVNSLPF